MTESTEYKVDRTGWPSGDWDDEPDREEWRAHGFPCLIVRNRLGALCGYVGLPPGHPLHGKDYSVAEASDLDVHGGLTFADSCRGHICHVPREGEPAEVWWLGFDCNHLGDIAPGMAAALNRVRPGFGSGSDLSDGTSYKRIGWVRTEVEQLAEQLSRVQP